MAARSTGQPGNHVEALHLVPRRHRDALRPEPLDLLAADGPALDRADDAVRGDNPEPGQSRGLLGRECSEAEGDLAALIDSLLPRADGRLHEHVIAAAERLLFTRVLQHTGGHQARASELLGINRATLRHKLRVLGLTATRPGIRNVTDDETGNGERGSS